jgi:hypothetical protein
MLPRAVERKQRSALLIAEDRYATYRRCSLKSQKVVRHRGILAGKKAKLTYEPALDGFGGATIGTARANRQRRLILSAQSVS